MLLKTYNTEDEFCTMLTVDPSTFRKWAWFVINKLRSISVVGLILSYIRDFKLFFFLANEL